jgi:hypothetical protein
MDNSDLAFDGVLSGRSNERRTALIVFPVVVVLVAILGAAAISISRVSGLRDQVTLSQRQAEAAAKTVEERDGQLRAARGDAAVLSSPGQGAAVLAATTAGSGANGIALYHPEQNAMNLYAYNLAPAPEGKEYRLVVTEAGGQERLLGAVTPDDRGATYALARDLPEGVSRLELALVAKGAAAPAPSVAAAQGTGAGASPPQAGPAAAQPAGQREAVLVGQFPKPGEAGVVMPKPEQRETSAGAKAPTPTRR